MDDTPLPRAAPSGHAAEMRARKRAAAERIGIDAAYVDRLVERFYARVRQDGLLGPIFAERIADWPVHLARMKQFWRSVLHNSGEFAGNPMAAHTAIPGLEEHHFAHWLDLFYATLRELERETARVAPAATHEVGTRARMIASSLLLGIATQRSGLAGAQVGKELPHVQS